MLAPKTVPRALALRVALLGPVGLTGCDSTPWIDESVLLEAPVVVAIDPVDAYMGMAVVHGPRTLLVSGHQAQPGALLHARSINRSLYTARVTDGIFERTRVGGWLRLELGQPLADSFRTFERDYTTPIPVGDPILVVSAKWPPTAPSDPRGPDAKKTVIRGRAVPAPAWDPEARPTDFLYIDADVGPGQSGSPAYWWPAASAAPIEVGVVVGERRARRDGRVIHRVSLVRRPHELVIP